MTMNKDDLKQLLNTLYEMEGLVDMAIRRGEDTPPQIYQLIAAKGECVAETLAACNLNKETETVQSFECETYSLEDEEPMLDNMDCENSGSDEQLRDVNIGVDDREPDEDIDVEFVYEEDEESAKEDTNEIADCSDEMVAENRSVENAEMNVVNSLFDASAFDVDDYDNDDSPESECEDDMKHDAEDVPAEYPDDDRLPEDSFSESRNLPRKDVRRMFTINDRYRFRRELFSNNDVDFNDNLNLIQAMTSYEDAEDYFYNDLQWDAESEDVIEFMSIIYKYFNS